MDQEEWGVRNSQGIFIFGITAEGELRSFSLVLSVIKFSYKRYRFSDFSSLFLLFLSIVL